MKLNNYNVNTGLEVGKTLKDSKYLGLEIDGNKFVCFYGRVYGVIATLERLNEVHVTHVHDSDLISKVKLAARERISLEEKVA